MDKYIIEHSESLVGDVKISGSKNSVLGLIATTLLCNETVVLKNVPNVSDVHNLLKALKSLGSIIDFNINSHILVINNENINPNICLNCEYIRKIRASYYILGALLGKYHYASVALPGGCSIGLRPIDLHIKGFEKLGANVSLKNGTITTEATELNGTTIFLDCVSVGATINIILSSVLAKGVTKIINVAKEPHVIDVINMLNKMGAKIFIEDDSIIKIVGVDKLYGIEYSVIPDQIEAGTFLIASAITKGDITISNIIPRHLESIIYQLDNIGCKIRLYNDAIRICNNQRLKGTQIITEPYPGFPTDMQPQMTTLLGLSYGISYIKENIFENRFTYATELMKLGAKIKLSHNICIIDGIHNYSGAIVTAPDLRAGASLILAGLVADNTTIVNNAHLVQRGYEDIDKKLSSLGANISYKKDKG